MKIRTDSKSWKEDTIMIPNRKLMSLSILGQVVIT